MLCHRTAAARSTGSSGAYRPRNTLIVFCSYRDAQYKAPSIAACTGPSTLWQQPQQQRLRNSPGGRRPAVLCMASSPPTPGAPGSGPDPSQPLPRGPALGPQHVPAIAQRWRPLLPDTPQERNRLLSRRMKALTYPDPYAYDIFKQDGKEYMSGSISPVEFRDRFFGVFGACPGADNLFVQMALMVPAPAKRLALLQLAEDPWALPEGPLELPELPAVPQEEDPTTVPVPRRQQQQPVMNPAEVARAAARGGGRAAAEGEGTDGYDEDEYEDEDEEAEEGEQLETAGFGAHEDEEEGEEGEEEGGDRGRSGGSGSSGGGQGDLREARGWQRLDRAKMEALVAQVLAEEAAAAEAAGGADRRGGADGGGEEEGAAAAAAPLAVLGGLTADAVHFNSASARPARKMAGKKSRGPDTRGQAAVGAGGVVVWLRQDLRIHDNPALCEAARVAAAQGATLTLVYVHSPDEDGDSPTAGSRWRPGAASLLWLRQALASLGADLVSRYGPGAAVVLKKGPYVAALREVAEAVGASRVLFCRRYEPAMVAADAKVADALAAEGYEVRSFPGLLLHEPQAVALDLSKWAGHYGTLTPFYRQWSKLARVPEPLPPPKRLPVAAESPVAKCGGLSLDDLGLYSPPKRRQQQQQQTSSAAAAEKALGTSSSGGQSEADQAVIDWGAPIRTAWEISESAALRLLDRFIAIGLSRYEADRAFADGRAVSRLSPYLHFGQLSARLVWQRLRMAQAQSVSKTFYRRLVWRDLAYWQLHHWPDMATEPIRVHYRDVEWASGPEAETHLKAWQQGLTGFPLVDAGMRELWATGWMQQSVRMVAACFLTEYLNLPWVEGARWFHDTLVDADAAINAMMWQNAGKSGIDQWNFTLSPTSKHQDPSGDYIRRWVPELSKVPTQYIHSPWLAPAASLEAAGVTLGVTYPHRIVTSDMASLRAASVGAIREARRMHASEWSDGRGYDLVIAPKGSTLKHDGTKVVVFTKKELRSFDAPLDEGAGEAEEGEEEEERGGGRGRRRRGGGNGGGEGVSRGERQRQKRPKAAGGSGRGGRATFRDLQQRTLDEYVSRL